MDLKIFWCRFNKYYAQKWANFLQWKDWILIASCAVTDNAKRKFIKEVKQQIKKGNKVYLTGCGAFSKNWEIDPAWFYTAYPSLLEYKDKITLLPEDIKFLKSDIIADNSNKITDNSQPWSCIAEDNNFCDKMQENKKTTQDNLWLTTNNQATLSPKSPENLQISVSPKNPKISIYTKGFVIVQLGCDSHCTFCITVKKRWAHRNRPVKEVIDEINQLYKNWTKEIVLTWINLASWGLPNTNTFPNPYFPKYLKEILQNTDIPRIRISSINPEFIQDSWYEILENKRILPYFHLSIQSGSDKILKLMWRHYTKQDVLKIINNLKQLKKEVPVNIGADIIVGFPGETKEDFQQTLEIAQHITKLHVFSFSSHQIWDTVPASKFPNQVDLKTKKQRKQQLIQLCNKNYKKLIKATKWLKVQVLIENNNSWRTQNYLKFHWKKNFHKWKIIEVIF